MMSEGISCQVLDEELQPLTFNVEWMGGLNYALANSRLPFVDKIVLTNNTEEAMENIKVNIDFEYNFIEKWENYVPRLESGESMILNPSLRIHAKEIFELTEVVHDQLTIQVEQEEMSLSESITDRFAVLPMDQWTGTQFFPESIASFVMPNLPEVIQLQQRAAQILKELTGDVSFSGYQQGDKNHVRQQMAAIYSAIYEQNIGYVKSPSSFLPLGQRVRTPQQVLSQKMGNCIEMAVLYASVAEACALNPFIVVVEGHAFAGVWLEENSFDINFLSDYAELAKQLAQGVNGVEILECTAMNQGMGKNFEQATRIARGNLENPGAFIGVIDVRRSHYFGILPLPVKVVESGLTKLVDYGLAEDALDQGHVTKNIEDFFLDTSQKNVLQKSDLWMRNLLDLSKRNALISFKIGSKSLQLFNSNLAGLEDALADGEEFELREAVSDWTRTSSGKSVKLEDIENEAEFVNRVSEMEFKSHRLRTFLTPGALERTLKALYREARDSQEESGASSLFLAMGFLRWYDPHDVRDADGRIAPRFAPIVLLPVDILRKSNGKYAIRLRDEDPQMNITLLEFLKQKYQISIGGLNPLPTDEKGINLPLVFSSLRKALLGRTSWDIVELAVLGHFSFSQFVMWDDLNRRFDRLSENKVVKALVSGRFTDYLSSDIQREDIERLSQSDDFILPTSADASQVHAILEASRGASFVLHGPPGTGKSQTITNMIANALYQGKTVLFVAEKMAALNVVHERLSKLGIGEFCLEMHSNKTNKRSVLEKLEQNLSLVASKETKEFQRKSQQITHLKQEIGDIVRELHKPRQQGYSIYELVSLSESYRHYPKYFQFDPKDLISYDRNQWDQVEEALQQLVVAGEALSTPIQQHPLRAFHKAGYALHLRPLLKEKLEDLESELNQVLSWEGTLNLVLSEENASLMVALADLMRQRNLKTQLNEKQWQMLLDEDMMRRLANLTTEHQALQVEKNELLSNYHADIVTLDWQEVKRQLLEAESSLFIVKGKRIKNALMPLIQMAKGNQEVTSDLAKVTLDQIANYQSRQLALEQEMSRLSDVFQFQYQQMLDVFDSLEDLYVLGLFARDHLEHNDFYELYHVYQSWEEDKPGEVQGRLNKIENLRGLLQAINEIAGVSVSLASYSDVESLLNDCQKWLDHLDEWKEWSTFYTSLARLGESGMDKLLLQLWDLWQGDAGTDFQWVDLVSIYRSSLIEALIQHYMSDIAVLSSFSGLALENQLQTFKRYIVDYENLAVDQIHQRLASQLPNPKTASNQEAKQLASLKRIIQSKGRSTSIRRLFQENGQVIRRLTPCLLMSPLSVAQYIDVDYPKFDLVIFDEASQIRTSIAVGAMSRGENCVIVGDPKQMPPTSFFNQQVYDEEYADLEDLESLLDDCLGVNLPELSLDCHYRSQSESLISFSNKNYYHNKMRTFPAPSDRKSSLSFHYVKGVYANQVNPNEAEAIVETVIERLKDEQKRKYSMGIVTFNQKQQALIEDMLQERLSRDPKLESIVQELVEPIFVKNLENVQGDERDVILFSVTYGPNEEGKVYRRFGPLNGKNGWRRLNVAASRSRVEMLVFSTMMPEEITISPTTSEGVRGLQKFLEMAHKGYIKEDGNQEKTLKSGTLEKEVAKSLGMLGFQVDYQVGASDFKISLAVVNPDRPEEYLAAVLIDDQAYARIPTVHDRERLVPSVLERMGWKIYRLWSLDWYENPQRELDKLVNYLMGLLPSDSILRKSINDLPKVQSSVRRSQVQVEGTATIQEVTIKDKLAIQSQIVSGEKATSLVENQLEYKSLPVDETLKDEEIGQQAEQSSKVVCAVLYPNIGTTSYNAPEVLESPDMLTKLIAEIIENEAPIYEELLHKRLANQLRGCRLTASIREQFVSATKRMKPKKQKIAGQVLYWGQLDPGSYQLVRLPSENYRREVDLIPPVELANAVYWSVKQSSEGRLDENELVRATASLLGFSRLNDKVEHAMKTGIKLAVKSQLIQKEKKVYYL